MTLTALGVLFGCFGLMTAALALYRKFLTMKEDDYIHVSPSEERLIPQQVEMAAKMSRIDHWGEVLTVVTVAFGLILGAAYLYHVFQAYY
jgi:hypothetical protein